MASLKQNHVILRKRMLIILTKLPLSELGLSHGRGPDARMFLGELAAKRKERVLQRIRFILAFDALTQVRIYNFFIHQLDCSPLCSFELSARSSKIGSSFFR